MRDPLVASKACVRRTGPGPYIGSWGSSGGSGHDVVFGFRDDGRAEVHAHVLDPDHVPLETGNWITIMSFIILRKDESDIK